MSLLRFGFEVPMECLLRGLLACVALVGGVSAQRYRSGANFSDDNGWRYLISQERVGQLGTARWWWQIGSVRSSGSVAFPFDWIGGAADLGDDKLLVSGWDGAQGWLAEVHFSLSGGVVTPALTSASIGATDLVNLVFHAPTGRLYGVDNSSRELWVATYSPGLVLGAWQVAATAMQCPALAARNSLFSIKPLDGVVGIEVSVSRELSSWHGPRHVVLDQNGGWTVEDPMQGQPLFVPAPAWNVGAFPLMTVNSSEYQLSIGGGSGPFAVVNADSNVVVFQGVHSGAPDMQVFSVPASVMQSGGLYFVESAPGSGYARSSLFRAENVWRRVSVDPNMLPAKVDMRTDFPTVGTDFISWELYWRGAAPPPYQDVLLTMVVGAWDNGFNPTMPFMGLEILAIPFGDLGAQVASWNSRGVVSFGWAIDVNNPALVGLKVAAQAIGALPTGQFIVSDAVGVQLVQ